MPNDRSFLSRTSPNERREALARKPLADIFDIAMHLDRGELEQELPDSTADQLLLKLAFMGEAPRATRIRDGFIIVWTSFGEFWFILNAAGTQLVTEQVL